MAKADGGELIARVMRENRVKYCFAINGGHLFPILGQLRNHDIKLIHMRHEQATAYAADAYARTTGCAPAAGSAPRSAPNTERPRGKDTSRFWKTDRFS